jgi:hypothetical protein
VEGSHDERERVLRKNHCRKVFVPLRLASVPVVPSTSARCPRRSALVPPTRTVTLRSRVARRFPHHLGRRDPSAMLSVEEGRRVEEEKLVASREAASGWKAKRPRSSNAHRHPSLTRRSPVPTSSAGHGHAHAMLRPAAAVGPFHVAAAAAAEEDRAWSKVQVCRAGVGGKAALTQSRCPRQSALVPPTRTVTLRSRVARRFPHHLPDTDGRESKRDEGSRLRWSR